MMQIKMIPLLIAVLMGWCDANPLEQLNNGNFREGARHWVMTRSDEYRSDVYLDVVDGQFVAEDLTKGKTWFLTLSQPVNIRKGRKYRLSLDLMGEADGNVVITIAHPTKDGHLWAPPVTPTSNWETHSFDFTGQYETDGGWYMDRKETYAGNEILDSMRTAWFEPYPMGNKPEDSSSYSILVLALGELTGSLKVRNVSIVEVP